MFIMYCFNILRDRNNFELLLLYRNIIYVGDSFPDIVEMHLIIIRQY